MGKKIPEIEIIGYSISVSADSFQDYTTLQKNLNSLTEQFFKAYGIKIKKRIANGHGGGIGDTLVGLVKLLWANQEFLLIPVQISRSGYYWVKHRFIKGYEHSPSRPTIHIF